MVTDPQKQKPTDRTVYKTLRHSLVCSVKLSLREMRVQTCRQYFVTTVDVDYGAVGIGSTVKPVLFACPLFREFHDLGNLAKITGRYIF